MSFHGHVEKGMVVLNSPLPLPDGTPVVVNPVSPTVGDFWKPYTLDELAEQQGVSVPATIEHLLGGWPAEELNDGFEAAFRDWREREQPS